MPSGTDIEAYLPPPVLWALRGHGSVSAGEHRGVVVMFIHTTGFEGLAGTQGSEAALGQLQEYTGKLVRLIEQYGGFLASNDIYFEGVKYIVVFGAPIAREEDSANALRLALALDSWLGQSGLTLRHRIGINGGNAFAGDIGAPYRREYTVMGDCVNLSARLMSAAQSGQTLVSAATAERAGAGFVFRELPAIRVKGKSDEIAIKALAGIDTSATVTTVDQRTPFVGRTQELERLREICLRVEGGEGQALLLKGDAGTGKSRLLLETVQYARARGWAVHQGRCFSHSSGSPFAPWIQVLRSLLGVGDNDVGANRDAGVVQAIERICPDHTPLAALLNPLLGLTLPASEVVMAMDEEARGQRLLDLLSATIVGAATESPVLIVIDDIHNSDESSIDLARRVQSDMINSRVLFAAGERVPGRNIFGARSGATTLSIGPLSNDEAERLARLTLGRKAAHPAALNVLLGKAHGNPLFIEEVARSIRESPGLAEKLAENDAEAEGILEGLVPDRLQNLMMSRIDRLEPALRDVVKAAAVVGSDIQAETVGTGLRAMGTGGDPGSSLSRLAAEGVLTFDAQRSHYNFTHALIQEVAYGNLSFTMRRAIHGGIAQEVESSRRDLTPAFEILAHHYGRSGNKAKTFEYSLKAGDKARGVFANDDAIRHYRRATALVSEINLESESVASVHTRLGDVLALTVRHKPAIGSYASALETCLGQRLHRITDPESLGLGRAAVGRSAAMRYMAADLCRKIGYVCDRQSDYSRALAWFEQSLEVLPATGGGSRGSSFIGLAGILYRAGRYDEAEGWAVKGLRSLAASGVSSELAHANNLLGVVYRDQGLLAKAIAHRLRALAMYERLGHLSGQADTLNNLGLDYFSNGHWDDAVSRFQSCREISERIGDADGVAIVRNNVGEVYLAQGDVEQAKAESRGLRKRHTVSGTWPSRAWPRRTSGKR
jgi:class 3 adenylate cyclase/tetratricopeptide (TPR) repeat protein